jgi:hypothetical protein
MIWEYQVTKQKLRQWRGDTLRGIRISINGKIREQINSFKYLGYNIAPKKEHGYG